MINPDVTVTVDFLGAHKIDFARGGYLDGAVVDEYSEMPGSIWKAAIYPQLADYSGWAIVIGTPKGRNAFYKLYQEALEKPSWGVHCYKVSDTHYLDEAELAVQLEELGPQLYEQEYELGWHAAIVGSYYGRLLNQAEAEGRIARGVTHDPDYQVSTAWDLGLNDKMVMWWWQQIGGELRIIDHHEQEGLSLTDALTMVKERKDDAGRLYSYKSHVFPWDLNTREMIYGHNRLNVAQSSLRGFGPVRVLERRSVEDGIEAVRRILPRCWFSRKRCSDGVDMMSLYRVKRDEKLDTNTRPLKDFSAHSADGFRTLAMGISGLSFKREEPEEESADWIDEDSPMDELMRKYGQGRHYFPGMLGD